MWLRLAVIGIVLWNVGGSAAVLVNRLDTDAQWPRPYIQTTSDVIYVYNPDKFEISVSPQNESNCPLMTATIQRFKNSMQAMQDIVTKQRWHDKNMKSETDTKDIDGKVNYKPIIELHISNRFKRDLITEYRDSECGIEKQGFFLKDTSVERENIEKYVYDKNRELDNKTPAKTRTNSTGSHSAWTLPMKDKKSANELSGLSISLTNESHRKYPYFYMNESYHIAVHDGRISISSPEIWGIMRGMETVSQLFFFSADYSDIAINKTFIEDGPNYPHRGLLLDTARHYISVDSILQTLDAMAMNKMNVFHWLLVNDESFPLQSEKHPELSEAASYHPQLVYTKFDIQKIVEYARTVGIRVIPELDMPAFVGSIQASHPDLLVKCRSSWSGRAILNPLLDETYELLGDLYKELLELFPDDYLHFGGSEIDRRSDCWMENPIISKYVEDHNITFPILLTEFYQRMVTVIPPEKKIILWEDPFIYGHFSNPLLQNVVVQINLNKECIGTAIKNERQVLWSMNYKLNDAQLLFGNLYMHDPRYLAAEFIQCSILLHKYVIGAEVTVFTEKVDDTNLHSFIWPRASAAAETLWTKNSSYPGWGTFYRANAHACRMRRRGFPVPLLAPGFCITADNVVRADYDDFENGPGRLL